MSSTRSIRFNRGQMAAPLRGKRSEKFEKYRTKYEKGLILAVSNVCPADLYSRACGHSTHHRSSLLSDSIQHTPPKMLTFIDLLSIVYHSLLYIVYIALLFSMLEWCKFASSILSWFVAHPRIFRLFMKGKFDPDPLWLNTHSLQKCGTILCIHSHP